MLGLNQGFKPKFLRHFANLAQPVTQAVEDYIEAVKAKTFPNETESY
jgi:3-methyl-2-oxobutanoate hydroxymethyltransferase